MPASASAVSQHLCNLPPSVDEIILIKVFHCATERRTAKWTNIKKPISNSCIFYFVLRFRRSIEFALCASFMHSIVDYMPQSIPNEWIIIDFIGHFARLLAPVDSVDSVDLFFVIFGAIFIRQWPVTFCVDRLMNWKRTEIAEMGASSLVSESRNAKKHFRLWHQIYAPVDNHFVFVDA